MKKSMLALLLGAAVLASGCDPTEEQIYATSYSIGAAAGLVANQVKFDDQSRNAIVEVVMILEQVIPGDGQTFEDAWTPVATDYVDRLVDQGRLSEGQRTLVLGAVGLFCKGVDYLFDVRFPKAKAYEKKVSAGVRGFASGFLGQFKPVNDERAKATVDREAYEYFQSIAK